MTHLPRCPPDSFHRTHSKFVCVSPPTELTEFTEASGGGYSPTEFTEFTEISGVEEPPTDFADAHRWLGCVRFCGFCGKIVWCLRGYGRMPYPPNLWASVKSVGGSSLPEASVSSVNSVGEPYAAKPSVCICAICGRIIKWAAWEVCQNSLILKKSQSPDFHKPGLCYV